MRLNLPFLRLDDNSPDLQLSEIKRTFVPVFATATPLYTKTDMGLKLFAGLLHGAFWGLLLLASGPARAVPDTALFRELLFKGDSVYRQKTGYASFQQSLCYFDSAQLLAEQSGNKALLGQATFARGRVYDAWTVEPRKTIELFTRATRLFKEAGLEARYFYAKHLIAHTYDKMADSAGAVKILAELVAEITPKSAAWRAGEPTISELAVIATEVGNYVLADSILQNLTRREWIANDPDTYNWLDHYYLAQARLDLYHRNKKQSAYPDSLAQAYGGISNVFDRIYYARQLATLYAKGGNYPQAYAFRTLHQELESQSLSNKDFEQMQRALVISETAGERRKVAYETAIGQSRTRVLWAVSTLLAIITVLSIYLYQRNKKYRTQSENLRQVNGALDQQVAQVALMNKEIQHRIKNNLYTIYSLLHMQQESTDNEEVIAHLEAARMRVESVAALHDHLLAGSQNVDFSAYLKVLVGKIVNCFSEERRVVTHIHTQPVTLPVNTCFALSLILNEWITNSIKYARAKSEMLEMEIAITNEPEQICILYTDNGEVPAGKRAAPGLGTEIVRLLTAQLQAQLLHPAGHPYHYRLCLTPQSNGNQN